jgi:hypothetical protein
MGMGLICFITDKTMNDRIVECGIRSKQVNYTVQIDSSTSIHAIHTAVITAVTTNYTLQLSLVKRPNTTMFI